MPLSNLHRLSHELLAAIRDRRHATPLDVRWLLLQLDPVGEEPHMIRFCLRGGVLGYVSVHPHLPRPFVFWASLWSVALERFSTAEAVLGRIERAMA